MTTYNLCDESWIRVRYFDGTVREIGMKQLFKDAEKIQDILPPVFRGEQLYFYYAILIHFLTTVIMSAYYKEDNGYAAKSLRYIEKLKESGLYSDTIKTYLDRYHDRFDLFSTEHPFLQNKALTAKPPKNVDISKKKRSKTSDKIDAEKKERVGFRTWNPFAPGWNNKVFGRIDLTLEEGEDLIDRYPLSAKECAYVLLYTACIGNSPCPAQYSETSIGDDITIYVATKGENLAKTLLSNITSLKNSARPLDDDTYADRPVWELEQIKDIEKFDIASFAHNRLLLSFFPGISMLITGCSDDGYITGMVRCNVPPVSKEQKGKAGSEPFTALSDGVNYIFTKAISEKYQASHTIRTTFRKKEGKNETVSYPYFRYDPQKTSAMALCISATTKTPDNIYCPFLEERNIEDGEKVYLYVREFGTKKMFLASSGMLNGNRTKTWQALQDDNNHSIAQKYQTYYTDANEALRSMISLLYLSDSIKEEKGAKETIGYDPAKDKEQERKDIASNMLSTWCENDFFGLFTDELLTAEDALTKAISRIKKKTIEIYEHITRSHVDAFETVKYRKQLYGILSKKEKEITK